MGVEGLEHSADGILHHRLGVDRVGIKPLDNLLGGAELQLRGELAGSDLRDRGRREEEEGEYDEMYAFHIVKKSGEKLRGVAAV